MKSLFLSNHEDIDSNILGGVQLCSQEFIEIIRCAGFDLSFFYVNISKHLSDRLLRKLKVDTYRLYRVNHFVNDLLKIISANKIKYVFLNKAELIRFAEPIKRAFGNNIKIIVLSHGNETGDFLHELTVNYSQKNNLSFMLKKIRLGLNLYTESYFRHHFIDNVITLSEEEKNVEKWLGCNRVYFLPRLVKEDILKWEPQVGLVGFVGTLDHTPNRLALLKICEIIKSSSKEIKLNIVGGPEEIGNEFSNTFDFANYLGRLDELSLKEEVSRWSFFINPIFWYSRGASMKLAKAISWGLPIITTEAGARGYKWTDGNLLITKNDPVEFVKHLISNSLNIDNIYHYKAQTEKVLRNSPDIKSLANQLYEFILQ